MDLLSRPDGFGRIRWLTSSPNKNAYFWDGTWKHTPRPAFQTSSARYFRRTKRRNHLELVRGTHSRFGYQYDIWQAVSPRRRRRISESVSGQNVPVMIGDCCLLAGTDDLRHILERDGRAIRPKLKGKIRIYTGDMDNWYLQNVVYLMEAFLPTRRIPLRWGRPSRLRQPHCWCGGAGFRCRCRC